MCWEIQYVEGDKFRLVDFNKSGFICGGNMVKVVFFDVDGTLISHSQNAVPESTRTALNQLSEKGIQRVIATGRHMLELSLLPVSNIHFDAYITLNGQLCLDAQGNTLFGNPITGKSKEYIIRMFHEKTVPIMIVEKENMYINFVNQNVQVAQDAISTPVPNVGEYTGNEIFQAIAYLEKGREETIAGQMPGCKVTRWNDFAVDIIAASGGKRVGIIEYLRKNNIRKEETMAFGDGENDIEMLRFVQIGVAMGNADDNIKGNSDYVTSSVDNNGIKEALVALKIIA